MAEGYAEEVWQSEKQTSQRLVASLDVATRTLETMPGARVLLLSSSALFSANIERDLDRVIEDALREGVVINILDAQGLYTESLGGNLSEQRTEGTSIMMHPKYWMAEDLQRLAARGAETAAFIELAENTGGRFFENNNDFVNGMRELTTGDTSYVLSFSPDPLKYDGKFHKLKVEVKAAGHFSVFARKGYFAPTAREAQHPLIAASQQPKITSTATASDEPKSSVTLPAEQQPAPAASTPPPVVQAKAPEPQIPTNQIENSNLACKNAADSTSCERQRELAFLRKASREAEHYTEAFADLTADETRVMQLFDDRGFAAKRSMKSTFVVYRLRNDPQTVLEYRDVTSLDGHEIEDHSARALKLWREVASAHSAQEEVSRITADSERYDKGIKQTGFTIFEGLPLRPRCARDFTFHFLRRDTLNGRPVQVFDYRQVRPCDAVTYHFELPSQFADAPLTHIGRVWLDDQSAQVVREERVVYVGDPKNAPVVARFVFEYSDSAFGILVPKAIFTELFLPREMTVTAFQPYATLLQTYGPFSRFEVSTEERISAPDQ
jgi:hypothetical protein